MGFKEKLPEWKAVGIEPPTSLKETGYKANDEPAPDHWNYIHNRGYLALKELQENAVHEEDYAVVTDPDTGLLARLNTEKSIEVTLGIGTTTVKATKDSLFNLTNIAGRMLLNLVGRDGNFESLAGWSFTGGSGALDTANKVYGSSAVRMTLSANTGTISKLIPVTTGKKYLLAADLKNGTANAKVYATGVSGTLVTSTTSFQTSYLLFTASSTTNLAIGISVSGAAGQVAYADTLRLYELSDADYNAASKMNTTGIVARYPYTEGLTGMKNPYAINWANLDKVEVRSMLALQTELLSDPVGLVPDNLYKGTDGGYYRNSNWRKLKPEDLIWQFLSSSAGIKSITTAISVVPDALLTSGLGTTYAVKFDGNILKSYSNNTTSDQAWIANDNSLRFSISNNESGWGDNYTPSSDEIKAFVLGWKMYDGSTNATDGLGVYNRTDGTNKRWTPLASYDGSTYSGNVSVVPVTPPEVAIPGGYRVSRNVTRYSVMYKTVDTYTQAISAEGQLRLISGDNIIEVGSGIVIREKVTPFKDATAWNINNGSPSSTGYEYSTSLTKQKVDRFVGIYSDSKLDKWTLYDNKITSAGALAQQKIENYDPMAIYTVSYITLDRYPSTSISGFYPVNEASLLKDLVSNVQQITTRTSVLEAKKTDKDSSQWITPTALLGWAGALGFGYRIEGKRVYFRGVLRDGLPTAGGLLFRIPESHRTNRSFTATFGSYTLSSGALVAIDFFADGRVSFVNNTALAYISFDGFSYPLD